MSTDQIQWKPVSALVIGDNVVDYGVLIQVTAPVLSNGNTEIGVKVTGQAADHWPASAQVQVHIPQPVYSVTATWTTTNPQHAQRWGQPGVTVQQLQLGADGPPVIGPVVQS